MKTKKTKFEHRQVDGGKIHMVDPRANWYFLCGLGSCMDGDWVTTKAVTCKTCLKAMQRTIVR